MNVSKKSLLVIALAGLAVAANATDVTTLNGGPLGWHAYGLDTSAPGTYPVGTASIVASPSGDGDGALRLTGDRSRAGIGVEEGYNGPNVTGFGTLDALAKGSFFVDLLRSSASQTNDNRYNIGVKLLFSGNQALTWENANNGGDTTTDAFVTHNVGVGNWFIRSGGMNYDTAVNNHSLQDWANGENLGGTVTGFNANSQVLGISLVVGSGISNGPNSFIGGADHVVANFQNGGSYSYNFKAVPEPSSVAALALGAFGLLRRRKRA